MELALAGFGGPDFGEGSMRPLSPKSENGSLPVAASSA